MNLWPETAWGILGTKITVYLAFLTNHNDGSFILRVLPLCITLVLDFWACMMNSKLCFFKDIGKICVLVFMCVCQLVGFICQ